jgi:hypothetical protein
MFFVLNYNDLLLNLKFNNKNLLILNKDICVLNLIKYKYLNKILKHKYLYLYFFKLKLVGVSFKAFSNKIFFFIDLGKNHGIILLIPSSINIIVKDSNFLIFSKNSQLLNSFIYSILTLKKRNLYKTKGFILKNEIIKLKVAKSKKKKN